MSIRKREWTTQKGEKKSAWVVDYVDMQGKRRLKTFARKKDADAFEATAKVEVREGVHVADSATVTVDEATKLWIASIRGSGLERSTVEDYERTHRLHVSPFIGSLKLTALNTIRLRAFEDELRSAERSAFTIKRTITSLGTMLADAQERGLVVRNAAREMQSRRSTSANRSERRQKGRLKVGVDIPAREEVSALLGAVSGRWRPFIITAVFTGLRASELRGLRWQDVDFDKRTVRVHQRADRYDNIGAPKSLAGERTMPVPPLLINALREWKLQCPKRKTAKLDAEGNPIMVLDLVFPNGAGNVEGLRNILRRGVHPAWMAAGVTVETGEFDKEGNPILGPKYTGLHCLRHWYASWCINRKEDGGLELPPKLVQERMGHSTIAMTMDTYGHLFPRNDDGKELEQAADAIFTGAN